jgi:3-phytase/alkaline phosphatase D
MLRYALIATTFLTTTATAAEPLRIASFNASLNRSGPGQLQNELVNGSPQARIIAEIIQRTNPDVVLVNEFDYVDPATPSAPLNVFADDYLAVPQNFLGLPQGSTGIDYPFRYAAPSNTGVYSGFDLDNDGNASPNDPGDAFGFGNFPGQFGMAVYSKVPITDVRTFQNFLWKDLPGNLLTNDPSPAGQNLDGFYSQDEIDNLRLSSKSHWDVTLDVDGNEVHLLAAHPTPPVFDGPEDRNGKRNFDEIRFWAEYIEGNDAIYDDSGTFGGLEENEAFVIVGDYNSDPNDGDSLTLNGLAAADQLLLNDLIDTSLTPGSDGGVDAADRQGGINNQHTGNPRFDTADFGDGSPGNLRVDYALPSKAGLDLVGGGVFWPEGDDPLFGLVGNGGFTSSDHRLVFVDVVVPEPATLGLIVTTVGTLLQRRRG